MAKFQLSGDNFDKKFVVNAENYADLFKQMEPELSKADSIHIKIFISWNTTWNVMNIKKLNP